MENKILDAALKFATKAHLNQTRSDGTPYIKHPERIAELVREFEKSNNLNTAIKAAYLHDTIEDTDTTYEDLEKLFGGLVASLVKELTNDQSEIDKIGKTEYLSKKMIGMSNLALVIKLADRLDNVSDIHTAKSPKWQKKYTKQTNDVLDKVEKNRELTQIHKNIIKLIRNKLKEF